MRTKSLLYTFEALLNSLLREFIDLDEIRLSDDKKSIKISNKENSVLSIELEHYSILGKHHYSDKHKIDNEKVSIQSSLEWVIEFSCEQMNQENLEQIVSFKKRVKQSQLNIEKFIIDLEDNIEENYKKRLSFIEAESLLILGHSFHPYPKSREGFSDRDFVKYSPEYKNTFSLAWAITDKENLLEKHESDFNEDWINIIAKECLGNERFHEILNSGKSLIPIHPWQLVHIRKKQFVKDLEKNKKILFISDESKIKWRSTSSIRSIYSQDCKYMLKFSMSLRLTNSIRHLQQEEVDRGIQVNEVFKTAQGKNLQKKWKNFNILHEPAYAALKNNLGETSIDTIVSCRINPFLNGSEENTTLLATLNQLSPSGRSIFDNYCKRENQDYFKEWFSKFTKIVITPLLDAQANFGIFLGAHQQNIILKIDDLGFPIKLYFRDCQGTGYSEQGYKDYSPYCTDMALDNGNILTKEQGQKIFCYYLIINTAFDTISNLSNLSKLEESIFLKILNNSLKELKENGVEDSSCIDYLLNDKYLWVKGNYKCCLKEINENTMKSPTDIYIPMKNPIEGNI